MLCLDDGESVTACTRVRWDVLMSSTLTKTDGCVFVDVLATDWSVLALVFDGDTDEEWNLVGVLDGLSSPARRPTWSHWTPI